MKIGLGIGLGVSSGVPVFDPRTVSNLKLDLWASSGVTLTSGVVSGWADRSTTGANASQATVASRPPPGTGMNGKPSIAVSSGKNLAGSLALAAGDWTIIVAHNPSSIANASAQVLLDWQTGRLLLDHVVSSGAWGYATPGYYDGVQQHAGDLGGPNAVTGPQVMSWRLNSTGGNSAAIRRNGVNLKTGLAYTQRALGGMQKIGSDYADLTPTATDLGRIIIYGGNLSDADLQTVERGIGAYYGITVA